MRILLNLVSFLVLVSAKYSLVAGNEQDPAAPGEPAAPETAAHPAHWTYSDQTDWSVAYPLCIGKAMRQSPIDIVTADVVEQNSMPLSFIDYDQKIAMTAKNTAHSVSVSPGQVNSKPTVKLGWLPEVNEFELQEVHFHWGAASTKGSEHKINGQRAAAEMHMVHFKKGVTKDEIGSVENSVVVVGVLIGESEDENEQLDLMIDETHVVNGTDPNLIKNIPSKENLRNLIPENLEKFYTYDGSLTTPPCYEVVTWVVLGTPIYMTPERLAELSNLATSEGGSMHRISENFRETQPLLDRPVYSSTNISIRSTDRLMKEQSYSFRILAWLHDKTGTMMESMLKE